MNEPQESNFYASASLWEGSFACNFDTDLFGKILLKKKIYLGRLWFYRAISQKLEYTPRVKQSITFSDQSSINLYLNVFFLEDKSHLVLQMSDS